VAPYPAKMLRVALGRLSGRRVARPGPLLTDPAFSGLSFNLSHVMHDTWNAPAVAAAARAAWSARRGRSIDPTSAWDPAALVALRRDGGLVVVAPVGPSLVAAPIARGAIGAVGVEPLGTGANVVPFFDAPAMVGAPSLAAALAGGRAIWFGWVARRPGRGGFEGALERCLVAGDGAGDPLAVAAELARCCEPVLRTYPAQCRATVPWWPAPFDPEAAPRVEG